nr:LacI family DNA-binding transcriptional regulator [uncultured Shuttleworthia sp.]
MGINEKHSQVNIYDVSEHAGVSIATVSRVLNQSDKVTAKTRDKVLASIKALGYQPNVFARGLGLGSMKTIGIMVTDASDTFLAKCVYHTEQELKRHGYSAILTCTGEELSSKKRSLKRLMSKQIDGLILIGSSYAEEKVSDQDYLRKAARSIPVVLINGRMDGKGIYCIYSNDFEAMFQTTSALLAAGRRRILYLYWADSYSGRQKLAGYRAAMGAAGVRVNGRYLIRISKELAAIDSCLRNQIASMSDEQSDSNPHSCPVDAVIGAEDIFAVAALKLAQEYGVAIPDQVQIIGYNNSILSQCTMPELTTIDNHCADMAKGAASILIQVLEGQQTSQETMVPCRLVQRGTTHFAGDTGI